MTEPGDKRPWQQPANRHKKPAGKSFPVGVLVWLGLFLLASAVIWILIDLFPGRLQSDNDRMELVRLVGLLALVSSGLLYVRRVNVGETLRNITVWLAIAAVLLVAYSYQDELLSAANRVRAELVPGQPVLVPQGVISITKASDGHFHVSGTVNGERISFLIDTGATGIVLSPDDARRAGTDPSKLEYTRVFETANGRGFGAPWRLDKLAVGPIVFRNVAVSVNQAPMSQSLLGMAFLDRLQSFEISGRKMILRQ